MFILNAVDGIHIKHNKIYITEDSHVKTVLIAPGDRCVLTVNGKQVSEPIQISPDDDVTWQGSEEVDPPFDLSVTKDCLYVQLTVYTDCHYKWLAQLESGKDGWVVNCFPAPDPTRPLTVQDVLLQYRKQKWQATIDRTAVERALAEKAAQPIVIAKGEPATVGKNGWIETHYPLDEEVPFEEAGDKLNYREKRRIPILRPGDLMATIHPPIPGKPGKDVWGRTIPPKSAKPVKYRLKQNVREKNGKVYAKITGRPNMTQGKNPVLDIAPVYTVPGDVDLTFGHVRFEGDVIVLGNIMETMKVTASQRIIVHGSVYGAELVAGGSIHVDQTVRKSYVYAGQRGILARKVEQPLKQLREQVMSAERSRKLLVNEAKKKQKTIQEADLLYRLLTDYYPDVLNQTKNVLNIFDQSKGFLPDELIPLQGNLEQLNSESTSRIRMTTWRAVIEQIEHCLADILPSLLQGETLTLQTADVSHLNVNGDVVFEGKGSTHSHISASERILFTKPKASCRGGTLEAGQLIIAENLGSLSGSKTHCRAGRRIAAKSIQHCDIQIEGPPRYVEEVTNIEYYKQGNQTLSRHRK